VRVEALNLGVVLGPASAPAEVDDGQLDRAKNSMYSSVGPSRKLGGVLVPANKSEIFLARRALY
jgi:hypothetical protein